MTSYSLTHLRDHELDAGLAKLCGQHFRLTAALVAHIAESETRKRYAAAGYPSMFAYCTGKLGLSESMTYKCIQAARTARDYPVIFAMLEDGRLNTSSVLDLKPVLTRENAAELLAATANRSRREIELLLSRRFPKPDMPTRLEPVASPVQLAPGLVGIAGDFANFDRPAPAQGPVTCGSASPAQLAPALICASIPSPAPIQPAADAPRSKATPLSPGRFGLQLTIDEETYELLRYAQSPDSHPVRPGDFAETLKRALRDHVQRLEQRRFAPCTRTRPASARSVRAQPAGQ